ncbi:hypothetical protein [Sphingomonas abaci]|uniref:Uncharacterized protein n=1 Tax=Sphingomonas abaci TaxID=237611 RepID=A0A7W7F135_9SPHN|nr:hypothetical protein [Sphingomonas abaci]MBB4618995.1 hypothetical protein [Sphingomonas abaci]
MRQIDPISVAEEHKRITQQADALKRRGSAALALGWFSDHALSKSGSGPRVPITSGVLPDQLRPIADATANVEHVRPYLTRAFREAHRSIIERAIELAQADFEQKEPQA